MMNNFILDLTNFLVVDSLKSIKMLEYNLKIYVDDAERMNVFLSHEIDLTKKISEISAEEVVEDAIKSHKPIIYKK